MTTKRNRVDEKPDEESIYIHAHSPSGSHSDYSCVMSRDIKAMSDTVSHNYHHRIAKGEVINNPMSMEVESIKTQNKSDYFAVGIGAYTGQTYSGTGGSLTNAIQQMAFLPMNSYGLQRISEPSSTRLIQRAKSRCLANVDSTPKEFMEDLFEIRETIEFFKSPLRSIKGVARAFSKKRKKIDSNPLWSARKKAEAISDLWSTYSFAVGPLIRSVMDAMEVFNENKIGAEPARSRRNARGFDTSVVSDSHVYTKNLGSGHIWTWSKEETVDVIYKASILYEVSNPLEDWKFHLGLRVKDIPETLWQIVPLSFMVDRLYNVSNVIRGITNLLDPTLTFLAASVTDRVWTSVSTSVLSQATPNWSVTIEPDIWNITKFRFSRDVWQPSIADVAPMAHNAEEMVRTLSNISDLIALTVLMLKGVGRN